MDSKRFCILRWESGNNTSKQVITNQVKLVENKREKKDFWYIPVQNTSDQTM